MVKMWAVVQLQTSLEIWLEWEIDLNLFFILESLIAFQ